jgi:hypothetical protein
MQKIVIINPKVAELPAVQIDIRGYPTIPDNLDDAVLNSMLIAKLRILIVWVVLICGAASVGAHEF